MEAGDRRTQCAGLAEQPQLPQGLQAGGLQQETGADRAGIRHALEDLDRMPVARQGQCRGLSAGAVTDDGDVPARHRAAQPASIARSRRAASSIAAATLSSTSCRVITSSTSGPAPAAQLATMARQA